MKRAVLFSLVWLLASVAVAAAPAPVYVTLWFDTEDFIEPQSDEALLRLAQELAAAGVPATFKVVGEKARTLERRGRVDIIRALAAHDIGYHTDFHSVPPAPAVYLRRMGLLEGAEEFYRREVGGVEDLKRIFGIQPTSFGQPGSSWGPQMMLALKRMGIPVYVDEGSQISLDDQPFWYGGMFYAFHMGRYLVRAELNDEAGLDATLKKFDEAVEGLRLRGGGLISTFYHPCEFATAEFWDAVNFARGADPERGEWKRPRLLTAEERERAHRILRGYVEHVRKQPGVRFVTAREFLQLYRGPRPPAVSQVEIRAHLAKGIDILDRPEGALSAADMLLALLGMDWLDVAGPARRGETTYKAASVPRARWERTKADTRAYIRAHQRLPAEVWIGAESLSLADFLATLAGDEGGGSVAVKRGTLLFERHVATDARRTYQWAIHTEDFAAPELLELARLQAWTLKPAKLR